MTAAAHTGVAAAEWRLLSLGFTAPSEEIVRELEALAESLRDQGDEELGELLAALRTTSADGLSAQYHALFGGSVRISPYEGGYELDPVRQGRELADVAAFYRAFGADADGPAAERHDHAGCELEFLAYLELRRLAALAEGDGEDAVLAEEIATAFLRDHAGRWLPAFFADIRETATEEQVYRLLAEHGTRFLRSELDRRGLEPAHRRRRGQLHAVEEDAFDCDDGPVRPRVGSRGEGGRHV